MSDMTASPVRNDTAMYVACAAAAAVTSALCSVPVIAALRLLSRLVR